MDRKTRVNWYVNIKKFQCISSINICFVELKTIARIARLGILFISDHFVMHYEDIVLRIGGESIKQRLQTVFHWINQNATLFQFHKAHCKINLKIS